MFFRPDATIFPKIEFDPDVIRQRLEVASYLQKGVRITFENEPAGEKVTYQHEEGLVEYLKTIVTERQAVPVHEAPFSLARENDESGIRLDLALQWTQSTDEHVRSLRQRDSDRVRRDPRERVPRGAGEGRPELHRDAQSVAQGRDAHGGGHP